MKKFAFALAAVLLAKVSAFAGVDLGTPGARTPYDAYMSPVKQVLGNLSSSGVDMTKVNELMREGRNFRYSFTTPYVAALPSVTESTKSGDCKAKSLWLCEKMGDRNIRFVVGKAHANSKMAHAWLMWENEGKWWILDPTNNSRAIAADSVSSSDYIAQYSWGKGGTYRHGGAANLASVATGKQKVASN